MIVQNYGRSCKKFLKNTSDRESILSIHGKTSPLDIVDEINSYFATIGSSLADEIGPRTLELNFVPDPHIPEF